MSNKIKYKISIGLCLVFLPLNALIPAALAQTRPSRPNKTNAISLDKYVAYFYNRYSRYLDKYGLIFKAPGYGITQFKRAETAREKLSLAAYYKYRAQRGDKRARRIIRENCAEAYQLWQNKKNENFSFSDAWVAMTLISLNQQLPLLFKKTERDKYYNFIKEKIINLIKAPDTENRATLSAIYTQIITDALSKKGLLNAGEQKKIDKLIYLKIKNVLDKNVSSDGWYREGRPLKFNPHYQLITAIAMAAYGQRTKNIEFTAAAKKMWLNLYGLSFGNGMIEARLGPRPVGLGAQFYLGMGWLSHYFRSSDYNVYLNYAYGDKFFSDSKHPNRLEYHSTIKNSYPDYHDDISFSNLGELLRLLPQFYQIKINLNRTQLIHPRQEIKFNGLLFKQSDDDQTIIFKGGNSKSTTEIPKVLIAQTYGWPRLPLTTENKKITHLLKALKKITSNKQLTPQSLNTLAAAYVYGGYNLDEINDTVLHGPRAVHPSIPAKLWRKSKTYLKYLQNRLNIARVNVF